MGQKSSKYDNYKVREMVGKGAFGKVYRATHRTTGEIVALKMLEMNTEEQRRSAEKEIGQLRKLEHKSHAHIVKYKDYFVKGNNIWLVMEYCSQGNLNEFLLGQPSKDVILRMMKEIADAVSFLHNNHIVHRDLKPDNILLSCNPWPSCPSDPVVKVGDFGLAKVCAVGDDSLLEHHSIKSPCGSYGFEAPEVFKVKCFTGESYRMYCDVFSMGVIFVAMVDREQIRGKVVAYVVATTWISSSLMSIGHYLRDYSHADLSDKILKGRVNERFKQLVLSMLRYDYRDRPVASSVLEQLNTILTLEPEPDRYPPVKKTEHPPDDNNRNNRRLMELNQPERRHQNVPPTQNTSPPERRHQNVPPTQNTSPPERRYQNVPPTQNTNPPERRPQNVPPTQNNQDRVLVLVGGAGTAGAAGAVLGAMVGGPLGAAVGGAVGMTVGAIVAAITDG